MGYSGRLAFVLAITISVCSLSPAQARRGGRPNTAAVAAAPDAAPDRLLRDAQLRYVEGKTEEAAALCQRLMEEDSALIRLRAMYLLGRSLWDGDDARDRIEARKAWDELARQAGDDRGGWVHIAIAKSLVLEDKSPKDAIATLQQAVNKEVAGLVTAEARIELARMLGDARRIEEAKACLAAAEKSVKEQTRGYADDAVPYQKAIDKVRKGLLEEQNPGLAEVEAADALLHDKQYAQAGQAYGDIIQRYPNAESADRAQVGLGQALCGLNRSKEALAILNKFIAAKPAGRWRGQAFAVTLDVLLEGEGPNLLKTAEWADTSLSLGVADKDAGASWKSAELELCLRIGIAQWINGNGTKAAANFERARQLSNEDAAEALTALIPVVKANKGLLPEGVAREGRQGQLDVASVSLSLAVVHGLSGRHDAAQAYVSRILDRRVAARAEQVAFAQLLQVCLEEAKGEAGSAEINKQYQKLARQYPNAPWVDEVLYRLGAMQDVTAKQATDADPQGLSSERMEHLTFEPVIEANVMDAYRAVMEKWPRSPRRERAMWRLGRILLDNGNGDQADQVFAQQLKDYPKGTYAGDAAVRLIDVALEYQFDLVRARQLAELGRNWAGSDLASKALQDQATLEPWRLFGKQPNLPVNEWVKYEVFLRAGMIAYLVEDFSEALALFEASGTQDPKAGMSNARLAEASLANLKAGCRRKVIPWDVRATDSCKTDAQRLAIKLADLYMYAARPERCLEIYHRFETGDPLLTPIPNDLKAYCVLRLALSSAQSQRDVPKAIKLYSQFYDAPLAKSVFAPDAILRLGVLVFNTKRDSIEAMKHYKYFLNHFPDHPGAEKAMYFYSLEAIRTKQLELARKSVDEFCRRFTGSPNESWRRDAQDELRKLEQSGENVTTTEKERRR